jgi:hypothetical protein
MPGTMYNDAIRHIAHGPQLNPAQIARLKGSDPVTEWRRVKRGVYGEPRNISGVWFAPLAGVEARIGIQFSETQIAAACDKSRKR